MQATITLLDDSTIVIENVTSHEDALDMLMSDEIENLTSITLL